MSSMIPACQAGTPEDFFIPNPDFKKGLPFDAVQCSISRARAVLDLIMDNGHDIKTGFMVSHATLIDALWCLSGILEQAETMMDYAIGTKG